MELPADEIKIDRSFGMRMNEEHDDVAIVRSTIDLTRNLGLDVVAEGVESREIWDKLQELGCQTAQGYYLSRPVPADTLTEWLRARLPLPLAAAARVRRPRAGGRLRVAATPALRWGRGLVLGRERTRAAVPLPPTALAGSRFTEVARSTAYRPENRALSATNG